MQVAVATATLALFDQNTTIASSPVLAYNLRAHLAISNSICPVSTYYDQLWAGRARPWVSGIRASRCSVMKTRAVGCSPWTCGELGTTTASTLSARCHLALQLMVASGWVECTVIDFLVLIYSNFY
jgi:hypothetical protein